jgi:hypothetical protein
LKPVPDNFENKTNNTRNNKSKYRIKIHVFLSPFKRSNKIKYAPINKPLTNTPMIKPTNPRACLI